MVTHVKKRIPIKDGLWTIPSSPDKEPQLIGSKCLACGELFFPKKDKGLCVHCQQKTLEEVKLSRRGKISSFTIVVRGPAGGFYKGPVPYAYGAVHLSDGVELYSLFTGNLDGLKIGMDVELVIEKLCEDQEGNDIMTYKFRAVK
jgi:uncharacterized OB-fold protein